MAELEIAQKRNIIILGRTGAGKKTIANHIVDSNVFQIDSSMKSLTREATFQDCSEKDTSRSVLYNIGVLDTVGSYSAEITNGAVFKQILRYLSNKVPEGINLILFTLRNGVYGEEEIRIFKSILERFEEEMRNISALVITGCESLDDEERKELIKDIRKEDPTQDVAKSMGKGIFPVGFPRLEKVKAALRDEYEQGILSDTETLQDLAKNAGEMFLENKIVRKKLESSISSRSGDRREELNVQTRCNIL